MPDILIRDIDPEIKRIIKARAKAHDRSLSDETKSLLQKGLAQKSGNGDTGGMGTFLRSLIPPEHWTDDWIPLRDTGDREPPDFS
jgi:hypothetical protein